MSKQKITKLTPEQEALIPVYREWRAIALSPERIDREKAAEKELHISKFPKNCKRKN